MVSVDDFRAGLVAEAQRVGFEVVGVAPVEPQGAGWFAPHVARLQAWIEAGHHADMAWIADRLEARVVPETLLPGVQSAVVLWLPHRTQAPPRPPHTGQVSAYAHGRDYHNVARKSMRKIRRWMVQRWPEIQTYMAVDAGPVLERAFGERAAVGWIGKSSMLIHPRLGTFGSLGVIFVDVDLGGAAEAHPDRCGTCTACIDDCPTDAIVEPGLVDARRCIAYWTIEHRGVIPVEMRRAIGDWLFGCDICQTSCPWNHKAPTADPARWRPVPEHAWPDPIEWLKVDPLIFEVRLEGSPLKRAFVAGLRRNALIVAANMGLEEALPLAEGLARQDPDPVIRATAVWAARSLGSAEAVGIAEADADARVRAEASSPLDA